MRWCIISGNGGIYHNGRPFGKGIKAFSTPGHTPDHCSLEISIQEKVYVIAGDAIWYPAKDLNEALNLADPYTYDPELLQKSRIRVWQTADIIIPGHGPAFAIEC